MCALYLDRNPPAEQTLEIKDLIETDIRAWQPEEILQVANTGLDAQPTDYNTILEQQGIGPLFKAAAKNIATSVAAAQNIDDPTRTALAVNAVGLIGAGKNTDPDKIVEKSRHSWVGNPEHQGFVKTVEMSGPDGSFGIQAETIAKSESLQNKQILASRLTYALAEKLYSEGKIDQSNPYFLLLDKKGTGGQLIQVIDVQGKLINPTAFEEQALQTLASENREDSKGIQKVTEVAINNFFADLAHNRIRGQTTTLSKGSKLSTPTDVYIKENDFSEEVKEELKKLQQLMSQIAVIADLHPEDNEEVPIRHQAGWADNYITTISIRNSLKPNNPQGVSIKLDTHHTATNGIHNRDWLWETIRQGTLYAHNATEPQISPSKTYSEKLPLISYGPSTKVVQELLTKKYKYQTSSGLLTPKGEEIAKGRLPSTAYELKSKWIQAETLNPDEIKNLNSLVSEKGRGILSTTEVNTPTGKKTLEQIYKENIAAKLRKEKSQLSSILQSKFNAQGEPTEDLVDNYYQIITNRLFHISPATTMLFSIEKVFDHLKVPIFTVASRQQLSDGTPGIPGEISLFSETNYRQTNASLYPPTRQATAFGRTVPFNLDAAAKYAFGNNVALANTKGHKGIGFTDVSLIAMGIGSEGFASKITELANQKIIGGLPETIDKTVRIDGAYVTQGTLTKNQAGVADSINKEIEEKTGYKIDVSQTFFRPPQKYLYNFGVAWDGEKNPIISFRINPHIENDPFSEMGVNIVSRLVCTALQQGRIEGVKEILGTKQDLSDIPPQMTQLMGIRPEATDQEIQTMAAQLEEAYKEKVNPQLDTNNPMIKTAFKQFAIDPHKALESITDDNQKEAFLQHLAVNHPNTFIKTLEQSPEIIYNILTNPDLINKLNLLVNYWTQHQQSEAIQSIRSAIKGETYRSSNPLPFQ